MERKVWQCDRCGKELDMPHGQMQLGEVTANVEFSMFGPDTDRIKYLKNLGEEKATERDHGISVSLCSRCASVMVFDIWHIKYPLKA